MQKAIFGGGCFWGVESLFSKTPGVLSVVSGYGGGHMENPTYKDVCTAKTGHAEVVFVTFDDKKVSYEELVDLFFRLHDPTQFNRQGPDYGPQYRSCIFCFDDAQLKAATKVRDRVQKYFDKKIVTEIAPYSNFFPAEAYHQGYADRHGIACHVVRAWPQVV
ncbi:MAG: peptide-methionine (S)-S-oxide reductase MsrA [Hydrotalea sp.]|nr:peptide-methionine (S)-S-oxide reductase MsrA [Hydrotalea sp.]